MRTMKKKIIDALTKYPHDEFFIYVWPKTIQKPEGLQAVAVAKTEAEAQKFLFQHLDLRADCQWVIRHLRWTSLDTFIEIAISHGG